ncbi:hypothetical protein CLF_103347, partial [Clonorchis sinensis]
NFRGRTLSESRRPYAFERSANERSSFRHYSYSQPSAHYRTTASHHISSGLSPGPMSHISRWSSVQGAGSHGLWRGSSGSRYATTLTRQHIKRQRDPVEMVVKAPNVLTDQTVPYVYLQVKNLSENEEPFYFQVAREIEDLTNASLSNQHWSICAIEFTEWCLSVISQSMMMTLGVVEATTQTVMQFDRGPTFVITNGGKAKRQIDFNSVSERKFVDNAHSEKKRGYAVRCKDHKYVLQMRSITVFIFDLLICLEQ